ncbi:MAG: 3'-5' exonuclease [Anaerolineales bacterium]
MTQVPIASRRQDSGGYISVDIEASGPTPGLYSMLALGACRVDDPARNFYAELQPTSMQSDPEAMAVHGLSLQMLQQSGRPPAEVMGAFDRWLSEVCPPPARPVFVAYNAPFDWMFVHDAFLTALGRDPFGHTALDIRALYVGWSGRPWPEIRFDELAERYLGSRRLTHNALEDALAQAEILQGLMDEMRSRTAVSTTDDE